MHAEAVSPQPQRLAIDIGKGLAAGNGQRLVQGSLGIMVHRAAEPAWRQLPI